MGGSPTTIIARWLPANPQTALNLFCRSLTSSTSRPATSRGRYAIQVRTLRLPASEQNGTEGRNMYIVRNMTEDGENVSVLVEDPAAAPRVRRLDKGKGKAKMEEGDELMALEALASGHEEDEYAHGRWTFSTIALPPGTCSSSTTPGASAIFDTFIQRTLFTPPPPDAPPGQSGGGFWQPRAASVSIEGHAFSVGVATGVAGDWTIKVGNVLVKGGTASGTVRGCVVEMTYLPVPYLPCSSTHVKDFLFSLFPPAAMQNGEVEILQVGEELFQDAGLLDPPDADEGEEEGEWEWQDKHSILAYVHQFKKEGLI
ncbi:hypothetical protein JCM11641_007466 [Rhodosporidiobolus odoratus]